MKIPIYKKQEYDNGKVSKVFKNLLLLFTFETLDSNKLHFNAHLKALGEAMEKGGRKMEGTRLLLRRSLKYFLFRFVRPGALLLWGGSRLDGRGDESAGRYEVRPALKYQSRNVQHL